VHALRGVDAVFPRGAMSAVVGPSGSGKSTLLQILATVERPTAGLVLVDGVEVTSRSSRELRALRRRDIGFVFQRPSHNLIPHLDAADHLRHAARVRRSDVDPVALLDLVGLEGRANHRPSQLSGGEQQRLAVAQAAVGDPILLLADEPTAELDHEAGAQVLALLAARAAAGSAVVITTHDPEVVAQADSTLALRDGAVGHEQRLDERLAVIDATGRVQLPPEALQHYPDGRARMDVTNDGHIRITPP
jgi:ABC-type lipoprotein export system ATPase subunit